MLYGTKCDLVYNSCNSRRRSPPGVVCEGVPSVAGVGVVPGCSGGFGSFWVTLRFCGSCGTLLAIALLTNCGGMLQDRVTVLREGRLSIGRSLS